MSDAAAAPARTNWSISREAIAPSLIIAAIVAGAIWVTLDAWTGKSTGMPTAAIAETQALIFAKQADSRLIVTRAKDGKVLATWPNMDEGFIPMVIRGVIHERRRHDVAPNEPIELLRRPDGRVTLRDPRIGTTIELKAFGPGNHAQFVDLMSVGRLSP